MSRPLPPHPNLKQLKHQAKDLRRAHASGEPSVCEPLKLLRRFDKASDEEILAADLALHEAQYALAMGYGFASWNAMKRHVEKVTGRPSPVRRKNGRTYVTGLEKHPIGHDGEHENSMIACIAGVMASMNEDFSYEYLMGTSGAAFRVQMAEPNWCASAACAPCGYDCVPGTMKTTGYRLVWIDTQRDGKWMDDGVKQALQAVPKSVDNGVPVIMSGKEAGLIVGYHDDGKLVVRPYAHDDDGYKDAEVFGAAAVLVPALIEVTAANDWAWAVGIIEPHDLPIDRHEAVANSMRLAVMLANTERFGHYLSGFAAIQYWIDGLPGKDRDHETNRRASKSHRLAYGKRPGHPLADNARYSRQASSPVEARAIVGGERRLGPSSAEPSRPQWKMGWWNIQPQMDIHHLYAAAPA